MFGSVRWIENHFGNEECIVFNEDFDSILLHYSSLCRITVVVSCGGHKTSLRPRKVMCIRENSSLMWQIQR